MTAKLMLLGASALVAIAMASAASAATIQTGAELVTKSAIRPAILNPEGPNSPNGPNNPNQPTGPQNPNGG